MTGIRDDTLHRAAVVSSLRAIWDRREEDVLEQVALLERATLCLIGGDLADELRRQALSAAHKLAGSVGTFGFAEASNIARRIEDQLDGEEDIDPTEVLRISDLVVRLRPELERGLPAEPADLDPAAILLDLRGLPAVEGTLRDLGELRRRWPAVPSLVLTDNTGFAHRMEAARWGATRFLHAGLRPPQIIEAALE